MATYYAVCNVNGPISKRLDAETAEAAVAEFEAADTQEWIDSASTDAEDDLDIDGTGMDEDDFDAALEAAGATLVDSLSLISVGQGPTQRVAHIANGWALWAVGPVA